MSRLIPILCLICISYSSYSQIRFEKEVRVKKDKVPSGAVSFVDSMKLPGTVKWFKETGLTNISFEAKTMVKKKRVSIEFSIDGKFEDMEIEIRPEEIQQIIFDKISDYLHTKHPRYKINKVQVQYSGDTNRILNYFFNDETAKGLNTNYEIVISAKTEGTFTWFEYLFDENGTFIHKSRIKLDMNDNIEF